MSQPQSDQRISDETPAQQETTTSPLVAAKALFSQTVYAPLWLMLALTALITLVGVCVGVRIAVMLSDAPTAISQQAPVAASSQIVSTPESSPKEAWVSPFRQMTGFDSSDGKSYSCADGLTPVQLTMGQTYKQRGTTLSLSENVSAHSKSIPFYPSSQQVSLSVKLDANDALPGFIIQPASQINFPTLYNQATIISSLGKGGEATYQLSADNLRYTREGGDRIAGAVICLK